MYRTIIVYTYLSMTAIVVNSEALDTTTTCESGVRGGSPALALDERTFALNTEAFEALRTRLRRMVFRNVESVHIRPEDFVVTNYWTGQNPNNPEASYAPDQAPAFTKVQLEQNVEFVAKHFRFQTKATGSSRGYGRALVGYSGDYAYLNPVTFELAKVAREKGQVDSSMIPPRTNDRICGLVNEEGTRYTAWFICSEQFYRMHQILISDTFDITDLALRRDWMSGNRLCTSTFRKWHLSCLEDEELGLDPKEVETRFYRLRTEPCSIQWVHVYAATVLMLKYREFPDETNVARNIKGPAMPYWDVPLGWLEEMCEKYEA